jgi:hypothetical protein
MVCGVGGVVCGVLALREHGARRPYSPWLTYCFGFLAGCLFAQVVKHVQQPETTLEAVAVHVSVVALLLTVWSVLNAYARLWSRSQGVAEASCHHD